MGCCLSTTDKFAAAPGAQKRLHSSVGTQGPRSDLDGESRAPPPVDEEVKEVLTEIPKPKLPPPSSPPLIPFAKSQILHSVDRGEEKKIQEPVFENKTELEDPEKIEQKIPICVNNGEISEVSEICSLSESMSATTITRDDDDDEEVHQRFNRSPMKLPKTREQLGQRRDRVVGKSPTRGTESSPARRNGLNGGGSVRSVQSRGPGLGQQPMGRRGWRDPGESSGRRSRSPATRVTDGRADRANVGRSPSERRSGMYSGRNAVGPVENSSSNRTVAEEPNKGDQWPANESLDNPLVSLECFIFL